MIIVELIGGHKLFSNYIVPVDSPFADISEFSKVANMFCPKNKCTVIGGGDLNARVGDIAQKLPTNCSYRKNVDREVNEHGKTLQEICKSYKCYILNNMDIGSITMDGNFTFHKGVRKSQNDLVLTNKAGLESVRSLCINEVGWNPSDHAPLSVMVELDVTDDKIAVEASLDILSDHSLSDVTKPKKISHERINWAAYRELVTNDYGNYENSVRLLSEKNKLQHLDSVVNLLSESLYKSATILTPPAVPTEEELFQRHRTVDEADRVLSEWREGKRSLNEVEAVRQEAITHFKENVARNEREAWASVLRESDSKALWQKINWKGTFDNSATSSKPSLSALSEQFMKKGQSFEDSTLLCDVTGDTYVPELDAPISVEEIVTTASKCLKDGKAASDGWTKKMITNLPLTILYAIQIIFNSILSARIYPTSWRITLVNEIFKNKGVTEEAVNYRGISLVALLSKLFDFIMNNRFTSWFKPHDAQTAYQRKRASIDHVFLLRCIVQQAMRVRQKIFIIAFDFDGAFDRISRSLLIRKLISAGVGTTFAACIAVMYMNTENIMFRHKDYVMYTLYSGIKQGLPLSPMLFIFYVNDIFEVFTRIHGRCVECIYKLIHLLVHADDVTLLAVNREGSIQKLCTLDSYCKANYILPQITKCKFIVVNGTDGDSDPLPFGDSLLANVNYLEILGSHLSHTGSLVDDLQLHMSKRYVSCIKFFNFCRENKLAPLSVKLKMLKACVMYSLLYNCESFGHKIPKNLETIYNKLIRCALGVRANTPVLLLYIETGLLPLQALIEARQLKYITRFPTTLQDGGVRQEVYNALVTDPSKYLKHYLQLTTKYTSTREIYKEHITAMKTKIHNFASNDRYKYQIYKEINPQLQPSPLLDCLHPLTADITRFRLGSHNLPIEKGRWNRVRRDQRVCTACDVLGDEKHIIYECSLINRDDLNLSDLSSIWTQQDVFPLFGRIRLTEYLC